MSDFLSLKPLEKLKAQIDFVEAEEEGKNQEDQQERAVASNPDAYKLEEMGLSELLRAGWCPVSWRGLGGERHSHYEFKPKAWNGDFIGEQFHKFGVDENGNTDGSTLPSYLKLKKLKAGDEPGIYWAYLYREGSTMPLDLIKLRLSIS